MTVSGYSGPASSPALSGVSSGGESLSCVVLRIGVEVCRITGSTVPFIYTNPSTAGGANGRFTFPALSMASGVITTSNGAGGRCPMGAGSAALTAITDPLSSTPQPILWQTNP
jgi:hypothetical protein